MDEEIPFEKIESKVGYRIVKQIGKGAFAKVFLALREGYGLDRYVAIKVVDMSLMDERHRTVILDEAKITGKLSHPNIIHIYDCGMVDSQYFFNVIELVNGYSLREIIHKHTSMVMDRLKGYERIPVSLLKHATASILMQICLGLSYIHNSRDLVTGENLNVIHNDLKPGNILIGFDGSLKISDFGISYSPLRSVKLKGGSPAYMAPEWIRSLLDGEKKVRPKETSDIYSLGVCLHETLTDRRLFRAKGNLSRNDMLEQIYEQMKNYKPGTTRRINPAADQELCRIADRCLRFDPSKRYQETQAIIDELDEMISEGHFHPQIMDRRFLAEYMDSLYLEDEHFRFLLGKES